LHPAASFKIARLLTALLPSDLLLLAQIGVLRFSLSMPSFDFSGRRRRQRAALLMKSGGSVAASFDIMIMSIAAM